MLPEHVEKSPDPTEAMICRSCTTPIPDESIFCMHCGAVASDPGSAPTRHLTDAGVADMLSRLRRDTAGQFEIERELGRGGMAVVYLAHEVHLKRRVALKVLPPELTFGEGAIDRFRREAQTAAALDHPHIIPIYRISAGGELFWYAMKFVGGRSLEATLRAEAPRPIAAFLPILEQVASALDWAHQRDVVHRDVKPANILIDEAGRAIVTDFGIAKAAFGTVLTASGALVGTPAYMAPEQCRGLEITGAADQYALGVTVYQLLAGRVPFEGDSAMTILHRHCFEEPPLLAQFRPDVAPEVRDAVHRALAKRPEDRFPSVGAFVAALARAPQSAQTPPTVSGARKPVGRHSRRVRPAVLAWAGLGLVAAVALAVWPRPSESARGGARTDPGGAFAAAPESAVTPPRARRESQPEAEPAPPSEQADRTARATQRGAPAGPRTDTAPADWAEIVRSNEAAVGVITAAVRGEYSEGTGFVVHGDGYMLTADFVVDSADTIWVTMAGQSMRRRADLVGTSSSSGLALIKIWRYQGPHVQAVDWAGTGAFQGEEAGMIWFPARSSGEISDQSPPPRHMLSMGVMSQVTEGVVQFEAFSLGGLGGSPIFNRSGEVVAVTRSVFRDARSLRVAVRPRRAIQFLPPHVREGLTTRASVARRSAFAEVVRANQGAVGLVSAWDADGVSDGTGFVVHPDGYMLTRQALVAPDSGRVVDSILVTMADQQLGRSRRARVVAASQSTGLALIKIDGYQGPHVRTVDWMGSGAHPGAGAVAIGFPLGFYAAVDSGANLNGGRLVRTSLKMAVVSRVREDVLQLGFFSEAPPGMGGSPVFTESGQLIAVHFGRGSGIPVRHAIPLLPPQTRAALGIR